MRWSEIRAAHPDQWLVVEALEAHSESDHRIFDRIAIMESCSDGRVAMKRYGELQREHPHREFCFVTRAKPSSYSRSGSGWASEGAYGSV